MKGELLREASGTSDASGPSEGIWSQQKQLSELSSALSNHVTHLQEVLL